MRQLMAITWVTFLRLTRDRIFIPAIVVGMFLMLLATLASDWGIEEFHKILGEP